ncbi:uncharacterized protein LOC124280541 [Haliotis rubra]|uniref:uncharacterized protein LOC124280541 n=1 Tax=Haliotis rubra TaxID=36100 RepID=UPI001EE52CE2|nr:uncharacterized protein LOC124280541 [Haliotis rubra]
MVDMMRAAVLVGVLLSVSSTFADASVEDELWDRFRLWFHTMDHNYDNVISLADTENCTARHVTESDHPATVRAKCEEFLPRWYKFFILRGHDSITENQFVQNFRELRDDDINKFEKIVFQGSKMFWIIIDMNNDRTITPDEDACVGDRPYDAFVLSVNFAIYMLYGITVEETVDPFCPWVY